MLEGRNEFEIAVLELVDYITRRVSGKRSFTPQFPHALSYKLNPYPAVVDVSYSPRGIVVISVMFKYKWTSDEIQEGHVIVAKVRGNSGNIVSDNNKLLGNIARSDRYMREGSPLNKYLDRAFSVV